MNDTPLALILLVAAVIIYLGRKEAMAYRSVVTLQNQALQTALDKEAGLNEALRNERALALDIINTARNPIFVIDNDLRLIQLNQGMADMFGLPQEAMLNKRLDGFIADSNQVQRLRQETHRMLHLGETSNITEFSLKDEKTGEKRYYSLDRRVLHGNTAGVVIVATDVTSLKKSIQEYRELQERYSHLIDNSNNLILQVDHKMTITYISPVCKKILGRNQPECLHLSWLDIVHPDDHQQLKAHFARWSMVGRSENKWKFKIVRRDGQTRLLLWSVSIYWKDSQFVGLQADGVDITREKELSDALLIERKRLEEIIGTYQTALEMQTRTP